MVGNRGTRLTELHHHAKCLACEWRAEGEDADKQAEKHSKQPGHPTVSSGEPR